MKEYPEAWIKALRSGQYKQCTGQLRKEFIINEYGYCCLGVLCDIVDHTKWCAINSWDRQSTTSIPITIVKLLDISLEGMLPFTGRNCSARETLMGLNDRGFTFDQIADLIEYFWSEMTEAR